MSRDFVFDLYRLNVRQESGHGSQALPLEGIKVVQSDEDIVKIFVHACHPNYARPDEVSTGTYTWSLTNFVELASKEEADGQVIAFQITRSTVQKVGPTPTEDGRTIIGVSDIVPPQSVMAQVICRLDKHLVAIEVFTEFMQSGKWLQMVHGVLDAAAEDMGYLSRLRFEVKPSKSEVEASFRSFDKLTRLQVTLWLPNPEVPDDAKGFYDELVSGNIRKFRQDMSNPNGLSREPGRLPHAAMSIAQAGYKEGELVLEGEKDGLPHEIRTGTNPCRGEVQKIRDYVRGMHTATKDPELKKTLKAVLREIDRINRDEPAS